MFDPVAVAVSSVCAVVLSVSAVAAVVYVPAARIHPVPGYVHCLHTNTKTLPHERACGRHHRVADHCGPSEQSRLSRSRRSAGASLHRCELLRGGRADTDGANTGDDEGETRGEF